MGHRLLVVVGSPSLYRYGWQTASLYTRHRHIDKPVPRIFCTIDLKQHAIPFRI